MNGKQQDKTDMVSAGSCPGTSSPADSQPNQPPAVGRYLCPVRESSPGTKSVFALNEEGTANNLSLALQAPVKLPSPQHLPPGAAAAQDGRGTYYAV